MENNYWTSHRIARIIALIDELWSVIDLLLTFIIHFGGEHVNGIFYQLELQVDLGILPPNQVTGRRALLGLLFFVSLLVNSLWIFGAFILFKATETTSHCTTSSRRRLQYCKIWLSISILLLTLHGLNMCIYMTESFLQMGFALSAFLTRSVFMYFVRKFMRELELAHHHSTTTTTTVVNMQPIVHLTRPPDGGETDLETDTLFIGSSPSSSSSMTRNGDCVNNNRSSRNSGGRATNNNRKYIIVSTTPTHAQGRSSNNNSNSSSTNGHGPPITSSVVNNDSPRRRQQPKQNRPRSTVQSVNEGGRHRHHHTREPQPQSQVRSISEGPSSSSASASASASASSSRTIITLNPLSS